MYVTTLNEMMQNGAYPNVMMTTFRVNVFRDENHLMCSW
jgi:hypothetical protein